MFCFFVLGVFCGSFYVWFGTEWVPNSYWFA
jgi:hypothetical protein